MEPAAVPAELAAAGSAAVVVVVVVAAESEEYPNCFHCHMQKLRIHMFPKQGAVRHMTLPRLIDRSVQKQVSFS